MFGKERLNQTGLIVATSVSTRWGEMNDEGEESHENCSFFSCVVHSKLSSNFLVFWKLHERDGLLLFELYRGSFFKVISLDHWSYDSLSMSTALAGG